MSSTSRNAFVVTGHTVDSIAGLRKDQLLYLPGAGPAGKAGGMIGLVACSIEGLLIHRALNRMASETRRTCHDGLVQNRKLAHVAVVGA